MSQATRAIVARCAAIAARLMLARYLLVSICALCVDTALFLAATHMGVAPAWAAFAGYATGILAHWMLSVRFVFGNAIDGEGPTHAQRVSFVGSALLGLAITVGLVSGLTAMGVAPVLAKGASVGVSFFAVYVIRKYVVFGAR